MSSTAQRHPHAVLDLPSRRLKAMKIERLLGLDRLPPGTAVRLLEIGTGSGGIAHYFATHEVIRYDVDAVDVIDQRRVPACYRFQLVEGTTLPFADASFDVVLSNHVIEHVGDAGAQQAHLGELRRVLKPGGLGYLAVPNRWMLIEPHYRLAFLSWLPRAWRTPYLRRSGRGDVYDCEPLRMAEIEAMLDAAALRHANVCIEALRLTFDIEKPGSLAERLAKSLPDWLLRPLVPLIPTLIYRLESS